MDGVSPLYAAIDLGSNSFHMLIVRKIAGAIRAVSKVKRKVRLAEGLDDNNYLSDEAIQRGIDCLKLFSEQLQYIPSENITIVATATLRIAKNSDKFCEQAKKVLGIDINIISGEEEARKIYYGAMSTSTSSGNTLVLDIGGASTELIIGCGDDVKVLHSTQMGCVTWLKQFFSNKLITNDQYLNAIDAAKQILMPIFEEYKTVGFSNCVGASGTVQALQEIMLATGDSEFITLDKLYLLKNRTIDCANFDSLSIAGLTKERLTVFPSGLSILIAIFELLDIKTMTLSGGALREGVIYEMLGKYSDIDVIDNTVNSLLARYQLDIVQAKRVRDISLKIFEMFNSLYGQYYKLCRTILSVASMIHEIGLCIEYKKAPQHAFYIINNIDFPGITYSQKVLLSAILYNQRDQFKIDVLKNQNAIPYMLSLQLSQILRLSIIMSIRRIDDNEDVKYTLKKDNIFQISVSKSWKDSHQLSYYLLKEEIISEKSVGLYLELLEID